MKTVTRTVLLSALLAAAVAATLLARPADTGPRPGPLWETKAAARPTSVPPDTTHDEDVAALAKAYDCVPLSKVSPRRPRPGRGCGRTGLSRRGVL